MLKSLLMDELNDNSLFNMDSVGVFVHLYYEAQVDYYISYLRNIPEDIDIYISTASSEKANIIEQRISSLPDIKKIIIGENRGRDIAALLVTFKTYIEKYDVICFVHDKKMNDEERDFLEMFRECMWDNLLHSQGHINEILRRFELNKKLGILLPPVLVGDYAHPWYGTDWNEYKQYIIEVANLIGLSTELTEEPVSYGTTFWARTEALSRLFNYEWSYECFEKEPIEKGKLLLTHGVERILYDVVKSAGFEGYNVFSKHYIMKHLNVLQNTALKMGTFINQYHGITDDAKLNSFEHKINELKNWCDRNVYIWGAGHYGGKCYERLISLGINIEGFLLSQKSSNEILGKKIYELEELKSNDICVLIAIKDEAAIKEIETRLKEKGVSKIKVFRGNL